MDAGGLGLQLEAPLHSRGAVFHLKTEAESEKVNGLPTRRNHSIRGANDFGFINHRPPQPSSRLRPVAVIFVGVSPTGC
jgi:hypothetical protein